jgi:hypothetical protein
LRKQLKRGKRSKFIESDDEDDLDEELMDDDAGPSTPTLASRTMPVVLHLSPEALRQFPPGSGVIADSAEDQSDDEEGQIEQDDEELGVEEDSDEEAGDELDEHQPGATEQAFNAGDGVDADSLPDISLNDILAYADANPDPFFGYGIGMNGSLYGSNHEIADQEGSFQTKLSVSASNPSSQSVLTREID